MKLNIFKLMSDMNISQINIRIPNAKTRTNFKTVLIGHSASGKSSLLNKLGLARDECDMDVFVQQNKLEHNLESFLEMIHRYPDYPIYVISNDASLLKEVSQAKNQKILSDFIFVYLKRPADKTFEFFKLPNTDGQRHKYLNRDEYDILYTAFDNKFREISDCLIEYDGTDISELAEGIDFVFGASLQAKPISPDAPPIRRSEKRNGGEERSFQEYYEIARSGVVSNLISQEEMREITAGGYQVFDATRFPPVPHPQSICGKKLNDLQWKTDEFKEQSVLEIGCQLGFFTFMALAKGASEVVGFDLNPRFITEANKIALHYKQNVCGWGDARAKFATRRFAPGENLGLKPDILITNSIVHWWVIQNPDKSIEEIMDWLRISVNQSVYFEGCVTAEESIMQQNGVSLERYNEKLFIDVCKSLFSDFEFIGRCSYDKRRIVVRLHR
ncbi:class I SAM-dependent methyltransferase [Aquamicrobium sp. LC103]|uniref:class I SAM-dependent methyltransferase n=1 Tax=Aquamicrobium sp. LC103 TaxID=1120658 RepID=UPI000A854122|nr:class I SAM-dependent methyltransferase [Aquamicrobium sp. LC103]TKT77653.1 class I SAM-dependent methyltransferase [Aquamicrobium sp. LC103]